MPELDINAIKAGWAPETPEGAEVWALCEALNAARIRARKAERDLKGAKSERDEAQEIAEEAVQRAGEAEVERDALRAALAVERAALDECLDRMDRAEAVLARVQTLCDDPYVCRRCPMPSGHRCITCQVRAALADDAPAAAGADVPPLVIRYRNYRGEIADRRIQPWGVEYGSTSWHPEPQWLLTGLDVDRCAGRTFAMRDMLVIEPDAPPAVCPDCSGRGYVEAPTDCGGCGGIPSPAHLPDCGIEQCPCQLPGLCCDAAGKLARVEAWAERAWPREFHKHGGYPTELFAALAGTVCDLVHQDPIHQEVSHDVRSDP